MATKKCSVCSQAIDFDNLEGHFIPESIAATVDFPIPSVGGKWYCDDCFAALAPPVVEAPPEPTPIVPAQITTTVTLQEPAPTEPDTTVIARNYVDKICQDVEERLYDLLITHLQESFEKLKKYDKHQAEHIKRFVSALEYAISDLTKKVTPGNKHHIYRHIILCCNKILLYETKREDIKKLKLDLIADYTADELKMGEYIPLNNQVTELRITWDTAYLQYLIKFLCSRGLWAKALYCWHAVKLVETDHPDLEKQYALIKAQLKDAARPEATVREIKNATVLLDTNVIIAKTFFDAGNYRLGGGAHEACEQRIMHLGNQGNKFMILPGSVSELKQHLVGVLDDAKKLSLKNPRILYDEVEEILTKRLDKQISNYQRTVTIEPGDIDTAREFFGRYPLLMEELTVQKMRKAGKRAYQLRKLAQRQELLPEQEDIELLASALALKRTSERVAIFTDDRDFTLLQGAIQKEFDIDVVSNYQSVGVQAGECR